MLFSLLKNVSTICACFYQILLGCITGTKLWFNKDYVCRSVDDALKEVRRTAEEDLDKLIFAYSWRGRLDNPNFSWHIFSLCRYGNIVLVNLETKIKKYYSCFYLLDFVDTTKLHSDETTQKTNCS